MTALSAKNADVVIIGSGIAGAMTAWPLAQQGLSVLILEAGPRITRAQIFEEFTKTDKFDPVSMYPNSRLAPRPDPDTPGGYLINTGPHAYVPQYIRAVGGTTWHWSAGTSRLHPDEFNLHSKYDVGTDWPINYDDLEPFYARADVELGVSGEEHELSERKRSTPFPMPTFPVPYLHKRVAEILEPHGFRFRPRQQARNTRVYDGRPACRGNNTCIPICPIGAQYAAVHHIEKCEEFGVEVLSDSPVVKLFSDASGSISQAEYMQAGNRRGKVSARVFVLAANAIESTRILLMSASERHPDGLANQSDQVGRNFMDHPGVATRIRTREPLYPGRGPTNAGSFANFSNGEFRRYRASAGLSIENRYRIHDLANELITEGHLGEQLDRKLRYNAARTFELLSFAEQLPDPERRVTLNWQARDSSGLPKPSIRFDVGAYTRRGLDHMRAVHRVVGQHLDAEEIKPVDVDYTANHLIGTLRMGNDPKTSVVDKECRSHQHPNLFVVGSAVFPTSGGHNGPTLTIAALGIRAAGTIAEQLRT